MLRAALRAGCQPTSAPRRAGSGALPPGRSSVHRSSLRRRPRRNCTESSSAIHSRALCTSLLALLLTGACSPSDPAATLPHDPAPERPAAEDTSGPHVRFVPAEAGEVAPAVQRFMAEARAASRVPLVYVGATWCEPCQYFHRAAVEGALDAALPRMALLEFDRDQDGERLEAAGYASRMIPLFVVPGDDGRGTDRRIEGSIHGPGSPDEIAPRLRAIAR